MDTRTHFFAERRKAFTEKRKAAAAKQKNIEAKDETIAAKAKRRQEAFLAYRRRREIAAMGLAAVLFVGALILVWSLSSGTKGPAGFGKFFPAVPENEWRARLSASLPGVWRGPEKDEGDKFTYKRFSQGDTMYCMYFGLLNIRSEPSSESAVAARASYGDAIQVFWKENSGYVRVHYRKPYTEEVVEGYCVIEELSETPPSDGRVLLDVPYFNQQDERWGELPLGDSYETIATAGCATSCLAMSYSYLEGSVVTPDAMAERLFYDEEGNLGFPKVYERNWDTNYLEISLAKLREGIPVLIGGFKEDGRPHWVLIRGYTGDGETLKASEFLIHDPYSGERPTLAEFFEDYPIYNKIVYFRGEDA